MEGFLRGDHDVLVRDDDHRVGPRHPAPPTRCRRARRPARPVPALPDPRARRPLRRAGPRVPLLPRRRRALDGGAGPPGRARRLHRARLRLPHRDARPRAARRRQPARRRAVGPRRRGRLRALLRAARRGRARSCRARRAGGGAAAGARRRRRRRLRAGATTSASRRPRWTSTAASRWPRSVDELRDLEAELDDRFGPLPEPVANLVVLQEARLALAPLGRGRASRVRGATGSRSAASTLGAVELRRCARRVPGLRLDSRTPRGVTARPDEGEPGWKRRGTLSLVSFAVRVEVAVAAPERRLAPSEPSREPAPPHSRESRDDAPPSILLSSRSPPPAVARRLRRLDAAAAATQADVPADVRRASSTASRSRRRDFDHLLEIALAQYKAQQQAAPEGRHAGVRALQQQAISSCPARASSRRGREARASKVDRGEGRRRSSQQTEDAGWRRRRVAEVRSRTPRATEADSRAAFAAVSWRRALYDKVTKARRRHRRRHPEALRQGQGDRYTTPSRARSSTSCSARRTARSRPPRSTRSTEASERARAAQGRRRLRRARHEVLGRPGRRRRQGRLRRHGRRVRPRVRRRPPSR